MGDPPFGFFAVIGILGFYGQLAATQAADAGRLPDRFTNLVGIWPGRDPDVEKSWPPPTELTRQQLVDALSNPFA